jgi:hypothetical protein
MTSCSRRTTPSTSAPSLTSFRLDPNRDMRMPSRFLTANVDKFAVRLAQQGVLIKDAPRSAYVAIKEAGISL